MHTGKEVKEWTEDQVPSLIGYQVCSWDFGQGSWRTTHGVSLPAFGFHLPALVESGTQLSWSPLRWEGTAPTLRSGAEASIFAIPPISSPCKNLPKIHPSCSLYSVTQLSGQIPVAWGHRPLMTFSLLVPSPPQAAGLQLHCLCHFMTWPIPTLASVHTSLLCSLPLKSLPGRYHQTHLPLTFTNFAHQSPLPHHKLKTHNTHVISKMTVLYTVLKWDGLGLKRWPSS